MSVGALSPEAHQALTIGIQRAGGSANTGEGGEDPAWYAPGPDGRRRDARIKQVASARFGVTADVPGPRRPARDQDRPGLEARRGRPAPRPQGDRVHRGAATRPAGPVATSARRRTTTSTRSRTSPSSSPTCGRSTRAPGSASSSSPARGVGTIAAGVAKAGASYIHLSGHAGGTGASPLSSIKHVGAPWELGLAEVHQVLLRNDLRDRVALRTDGGLQTGRDLLVAALLGAEEFAFGTAALVADRLRHGPPVPPRHLPDRDRHPARGPAREVRRDARGRRALLHRRRRGPPPRAGGGRVRAAWARSSARAGGCCGRWRRHAPSWRRSSGRRPWAAGAGPSGRSRERRPRGPPRPGVRARGRHRDRVPWPGIGDRERPAHHDGRPLVRGGPDRVDRTRRPARAGPASSCAARPASRSGRGSPRPSRSASSARRTTTSARACRAAP